MRIHVCARRTAEIGLLLIVVLLLMVTGCSNDSENSTTTTASEGTTTSVTGTATTGDVGSTSTSLPIQLTAWDKELKKTAAAQHELSVVLMDENAANDDPRMGIIYGLSARTQSIACRQALDKGDLDLADTAMREVYYQLNLARNVATGTVAQTIAGARAIVEPLGRPSSAAGEAARLLDEFITALGPLLDQAAALIPEETTTTT